MEKEMRSYTKKYKEQEGWAHMVTKRQEELVHTYLLGLDDKTRPLYREIAGQLYELGYHPHKERSYLVFKHDLHNKQMAKMGRKNDKAQTPYFALRFSACRGYSPRVAGIVAAAVARYPARAARCIDGGCHFCQGEPASHVYTHTFSDGRSQSHCGAYALEIPDILPEELDEIKRLIQEEHAFLLKYEAGVSM